MRDRGKPFVKYYRGPTSFTLVPRGFKGWAQTMVWAALLLPLLMWLADHHHPHVSKAEYANAFVLFGIGVSVWLVGGVWWMSANAERVDVSELRRKRQRERQRERRLQQERKKDRTDRQS